MSCRGGQPAESRSGGWHVACRRCSLSLSAWACAMARYGYPCFRPSGRELVCLPGGRDTPWVAQVCPLAGRGLLPGGQRKTCSGAEVCPSGVVGRAGVRGIGRGGRRGGLVRRAVPFSKAGRSLRAGRGVASGRWARVDTKKGSLTTSTIFLTLNLNLYEKTWRKCTLFFPGYVVSNVRAKCKVALVNVC